MAPKEKEDCFKCTVAKITKGGRKISLLVAGKNKNKSRQQKLSKQEVLDQMRTKLEKDSLVIAKKQKLRRQKKVVTTSETTDKPAADKTVNAAAVVDPAAKPAAAGDATADAAAAKPAGQTETVTTSETVNAAVVDPAEKPAPAAAGDAAADAAAAENPVTKVLEMATIIALAEARNINELQRIGERIAKHLAENGPGLGALYPHGVSARRVCMAYPHTAWHICRVVPSICASHISTAYPQCA